MYQYPNMQIAYRELGRKLNEVGYRVDGKSWQSTKAPAPTLELLNADFCIPMPSKPFDLQKDVEANLPWAEDHFQERVNGVPYNPPPSHSYWPFGSKTEQFAPGGKFSHTYPERIWPKFAGEPWQSGQGHQDDAGNSGIRYLYGDLQDVIMLLRNDPDTRQAYLPIWFPEDTGVVHGERVPCTLGYHFIIRHGYLHCNYYMRSCDYFRHFKDDVYMAIRLAQWVKGNVNPGLSMGKLSMYITSLHIFLNEKPKLNAEPNRRY